MSAFLKLLALAIVGLITCDMEAGEPARIDRIPFSDGPAVIGAASAKVYRAAFKASRTYVIEMKGTDSGAETDERFQPYLTLLHKGAPVAHSDGNARWTPKSETHLIFACPREGLYDIIAGTRAGGALTFTLTVHALDSQFLRDRGTFILEVPQSPDKRATLTADDPRDSVRGTPAKDYLVEFKKHHIYEIEMRAFSRIFGPCLRLETTGRHTRQVMSATARDIAGDGRADELATRMTYYCRAAGTFRIVATSLFGMPGDFQFTVREVQPHLRELKSATKLEIRDSLTTADQRDTVLKTSPAKTYLIKFFRGYSYDIALRTLKIGHGESAVAFDAVLRLEDDGGREIAFNDDEEAGFVRPSSTDSRITFKCPRDGTYRIIATSLDAYYVNPARFPQAGCGVFALSVRQRPLDLTPGGPPIEDAVTHAHPRDRLTKDSPSKSYAVHFDAGKNYRIELHSEAFPGLLRLANDQGQTLQSDCDVTQKTRTCRVDFRCERSGTYHVTVTSIQAGIGRFTIVIREEK